MYGRLGAAGPAKSLITGEIFKPTKRKAEMWPPATEYRGQLERAADRILDRDSHGRVT
jgi:hypothetical protein